EIEQLIDRRLGPKLDDLLKLSGRAPEPGAIEQVSRLHGIERISLGGLVRLKLGMHGNAAFRDMSRRCHINVHGFQLFRAVRTPVGDAGPTDYTPPDDRRAHAPARPLPGPR